MDKKPRGRDTRPSKRPESAPKGSYTSNATLICFAAILLLVLANVKIFSGIITDNPDTVVEYEEATSSAKEEEKTAEQVAIEKELEASFEKVTVAFDDTKRGNLILVNNTFPFSFEAYTTFVKDEELVPFVQHMTGNYVVSYPAKETLTESAMVAFNEMTDDFAEQTGHRDLYLLDSYRTYDDQQRIYGEKGGEIAALPGHSEHHTGLAFDLELYINGARADYDGSGDYSWINENCHSYGFILRYPESKTPITGFIYEPWHYRYVGKEHAYYMKANNLCLEEYIQLLSTKKADGERLTFTTDDGEEYMIYSQSVSGDGSEVYIPKNYEYTLSGDNCGNMIVSCLISKGE